MKDEVYVDNRTNTNLSRRTDRHRLGPPAPTSSILMFWFRSHTTVITRSLSQAQNLALLSLFRPYYYYYMIV